MAQYGASTPRHLWRPKRRLNRWHDGGSAKFSMRLALVTNIPAPYRVPVYNRLAATDGIDLHVFYAVEREPDRNWDLPAFTHAHTFLKGRMYTRSGRFIHDSLEIFDRLKDFAPDVVVTTGYNPTHLYAVGYALWYKRHHVAMTDGTDLSEAGLSPLHRKLRQFVLTRSSSFIAASNGGRRLFHQYGIGDHKIQFSPLCANTSVDWVTAAPLEPPIDLLFSGRLVEIKNAKFFLEVAHLVAQRLGRRVRAAILGSGPQEAQLRAQAALIASDVDVRFAGHVSQADMPRWFLGARIFLFPTLWDPWGIVANEACHAGLPVLVSPHAGVAGELVLDGVNGYVLPLDTSTWAEAAARLLDSPPLHAAMAAEARRLVARYSFENAASGIERAARAAMAPRVLCVQRRLTHYRVPLFEEVRKLLVADGVNFELAHGQPTAAESSKEDEGVLAWADRVPCKYLLRGHLCWQNPSRLASGAELVIVTQENKLLYNLWAMVVKRPKRLAYWGHGRDFQSGNPGGWSERMKRVLASRVDWWFAYTGLTSRLVRSTGFPVERITDLQNAVDSSELVRQCEAVSDADIENFRAGWGIGTGPIGLFVGSLYTDKRLVFLLEAGARLAARIPGFVLVVVGSGPQSDLIEQAARQYAWLRYGGARFGPEKAICLRAADVMLNPGLVGLGILDSFAAGLPMVTTDCGLHSPEIDYLRSGENGIMTVDTQDAFSGAVQGLITDPALRRKLGAAAKADAAHYTIDNMAQNFRRGVLAALALPAH